MTHLIISLNTRAHSLPHDTVQVHFPGHLFTETGTLEKKKEFVQSNSAPA